MSKSPSDPYLETVARLEPDIAPVDLVSAMTSIAVSLKRIVDKVCGDKTHLDIVEHLGKVLSENQR